MLKTFAAAVLVLLPMAPASAGSLEAYTRLPAMQDVEISSDGANLAYIAGDGESSHVVVQSVAGEMLQAINLGQRKVRDVSWADEGHVIVQVSSTTNIPGVALRGEYFQALSLNIKTGALVQLPNGSRDTVLNVMWSTPFGGQWKGKPVIWAEIMAKEAYADQDGHYDVYRMDPDSGTGYRHQMGDKDTTGYLMKDDGVILARTKYNFRDGRWSLDLRRNGAWSEVHAAEGRLDLPWVQGLTLDETGLILSTWDAKAKEWAQSTINLADGKRSEPVTNNRPLTTILDARNRVIGSAWEETYVEYDFTEPRLKAAWAQIKPVFAGRQVTLSSFTPDFSKLIIHVQGTGEPGGYYLADMGVKKIRKVGSEYPALTGADIAQVQAIRYQAADGLRINGYLTLPNGRAPKNLPLIVLPHGGPQSRDSAGFDWWAQALASRGYAVLQPNFRGSSGFGRAFIEAGYGEWGGKMQTDLSDGVRALAKAGTIDPGRVCIVGGSYGGYAALAGITLDKGVYRCAVSVNGVSDMAKMLNREIMEGSNESSAVHYWKRYMAVEKASDPKLAARSPVNFAQQADGPVLLIHGKDDTIVAYEQSVDMRRALEKAAKPVDFLTLPAEDHWLSKGATRQQAMSAMVAFLEKNNPPN